MMPGLGLGIGVTRGLRPSAFDPSSVSGLVAWWQPSAPTLSSVATPLTATGDATPGGFVLDRVASLSLGATQGNGNNPTIRLSGADGIPHFDGEGITGTTNVGASGTFGPITGDFSFFALVYVDAETVSGTSSSLFQLDNSAGGNPLMDFNSPDTLSFRVRNSAGTIASTSSVRPDIRGGWKVLSGVMDSVGGVGQGWVNGVSMGTLSGVTGANSLNRFRTSSNTLAGQRVAAVLIYSRVVITAERQQIEAYLTGLVSGATAETIPATAVSVSTLAGYDTEFDASAAGVLTLSGSAAVDGGFVDSWGKLFGPVAAMTEATNRPTMRVESGVNVLEFPATGTPRLGANFTQRNLSAMTFYIVAKVTTQDALVGGLAAFGSNSSGNPYYSPAAGLSSSNTSTQWATTAGVNEQAANVSRDTSWHVWAVTYDPAGGLWRHFLDGAEVGGAYGGGSSAVAPQAVIGTMSGGLFPWDHLGVGYRSGAGRPCGFRIANLSVATACHTPRQGRQVVQSMRSRYPSLFGSYTTDPQVVWVGASNLTDTGTLGTGIPNATAGLTATYSRFYVTARGGQNSLNAHRRVRHELPYLWAGVTGKKIACIYVGGNDFINGWSDATLENNALALFRRVRSAGATRIIVGTQLPRSGASDTQRATYNTWLAGLVPGTIDAIADMAGDATIGPNGANANATYYLGDQIHLTTAGCAIAAPYWRVAIDSFLP